MSMNRKISKILFLTNITFLLYYLLKNHDESKPIDQAYCEPLLSIDKQHRVELNGEMYPQFVTPYNNQSINFNCLNKNNKTKLILLWNSFMGRPDYYYGLGKIKPFSDNDCPVTNCELTNDKTKLNDADLVVVHMLEKIDPPPRQRPTAQRWTFLLYESPVHSKDFSKYNGVFNYTSTYKLDADYTRDISGMMWKKNPNFDVNYDFTQGKTDFAVAVISNCGAPSKRLEYIKEMQIHVQVDVYGACGKKCPFEGIKCKQHLADKYKFYLSFENSHCVGYITEKFFYTLKYNIIPVVRGAGDYEKIVILFQVIFNRFQEEFDFNF